MDAPSLAGKLRLYNQSEIARRLGVKPKVVGRWARDEFSPEVANLPRLAEVLEMDLAELTTIVADDSKRRSARGIPSDGAAA